MNYRIVIAAMVLMQLVACVPQRQFNDLKTSYEDLLSEHANLRTDVTGNADAKMSMETRLAAMEATIASLKEDTAFLNNRIKKIESTSFDYDEELKMRNAQLETSIKDREALSMELENKRNELREKEKQLEERDKALMLRIETTTTKEVELETLKTQLASREKEIADKEKMLADQRTEISGKDANINELNSDLAAREAKVKELETMIASQQQQSQELESKISTALGDFNDTELTINRKQGKVYISLQEKLLFQSGSTSIDMKGKEAIGKLADVLKNNRDISVVIEGHTDNVPYGGSGKVKDNWDLSVLRATSIVRLLVDTYGVSPTRVLASGRGEHLPVSANTSADGKKQNRRIEIILSPKLDELFDIMGN